jgi:uncharacterized DUF497 family protein
MRFEWDPDKADSNLEKHGIAFRRAVRVFDDPHATTTDVTKPEHGEIRFKTVGLVRGMFITVIFTDRGLIRRIISARRSRRNERREYDQGKAAR